MGATLCVACFVFLFSMPSSCQQKATAPATVCVQASQLKITPTALPQAFVGVAYSASINSMATGGTAPYQWAVTSGALPAGITLASDGVLSGTPTASGNTTFTVTVTDSSTACTTATAAKRPAPQKASIAIRTAL